MAGGSGGQASSKIVFVYLNRARSPSDVPVWHLPFQRPTVRPLTNNLRADLQYRDNGREDQHRGTPPHHRPRNGRRDGLLVQPIRPHRTWSYREYQAVSQELLQKTSSIALPSTHHLRAVRPSEMTKCKTRETVAKFSRAKRYRLGNCPQRVETTFWSRHQTPTKFGAEIFGQQNRAAYR
jgi:hypothetical protein